MPLSSTETIGVVILTLLILSLFGMVSARISGLQSRMAALNRIDAKLDLLLQQANIKYDPFRNVAPEVVEAIRAGRKITAIKLYRLSTGVGLKESKDFVEELQRQGGLAG